QVAHLGDTENPDDEGDEGDDAHGSSDLHADGGVPEGAAARGGGEGFCGHRSSLWVRGRPAGAPAVRGLGPRRRAVAVTRDGRAHPAHTPPVGRGAAVVRRPSRGTSPAQCVNCATRACRSADIRASSSAAPLSWPRTSVVVTAAVATPVMLVAISPEPVAASVTLRAISLVVAVCSSTAEAMVSW